MVEFYEVNVVLIVLVGYVGLKLIFVVIDVGKDIVLVNKEIFVVVGELVIVWVCVKGINIYLVDLEYFVIF